MFSFPFSFTLVGVFFLFSPKSPISSASRHGSKKYGGCNLLKKAFKTVKICQHIIWIIDPKKYLYFSGDLRDRTSRWFFSKIFLVTPKKHSHRKENQTKRQWNEVQANILVTQKIYNMTWGVAFFFFFWFYSRFRISALFLDIGQTELLKTQKFLWCKETISFCSQAWI